MPSAKVLEAKKQQVDALKETLSSAIAGVVVDYKGINVSTDTALRKELRETGIKYVVVKNTLLHLAIAGTSLSGLDDVLSGTTAIATSADDHVAAARILCKLADAHENFTVKAGFLDGNLISLDMVNSLAKLPSREVLLATVCNVFNAPIAAFARSIQAIVDKTDSAIAE